MPSNPPAQRLQSAKETARLGYLNAVIADVARTSAGDLNDDWLEGSKAAGLEARKEPILKAVGAPNDRKRTLRAKANGVRTATLELEDPETWDRVIWPAVTAREAKVLQQEYLAIVDREGAKSAERYLRTSYAAALDPLDGTELSPEALRLAQGRKASELAAVESVARKFAAPLEEVEYADADYAPMDPKQRWPGRMRALVWEGEVARLEQAAVTALQRRLGEARKNLAKAHENNPGLWQSPGLRDALDDALKVVSGANPALDDATRLGTTAGLDIATGEANLHGWGDLSGQFRATPNLSAAALVTAKSTDSIRKMQAALKQRILDTVSVGVLEGEGAYEIAKRVLGTGLKGLAGRDGAFRSASWRSEAIARTTVNEAFNRAAVDQYDRLNSEYPALGLEYEWVSQIDRRTSLVCRALNGKRRKQTEEFSAEGWTGKQGPAHPFCRSRVVAVVTKDATKLAKPEPARTSRPEPKPAPKPVPSGSVSVPGLPPLRSRRPEWDDWRGTWGSAPPELRSVFDTLGEPKRIPTRPNMGAFYSASPLHAGLHMAQENPTTPRGKATFMHEMGHYLDSTIVRLRAQDRLAKTGVRPEEYAQLDKLDPGQLAYLKATKWGDLPDRWKATVLGWEEQLAAKFTDKSRLFFSNTETFDAARRADAQKLVAAKTTPDQVNSAYELLTAARRESTGDLKGDLVKRLNAAHPGTLATKLVNRLEPSELRSRELAILLVNPQDPNILADLTDHAVFGERVGVTPDLIGAATLEEVGRGHGKDYYREVGGKGRQNTEMFANVTALYGSGDPLAREYLETVTPDTTRVYTKALEYVNKTYGAR